LVALYTADLQFVKLTICTNISRYTVLYTTNDLPS